MKACHLTQGRGRNLRLVLPARSFAILTSALFLCVANVGWSGGVVTQCTEADLRAAMAGGGLVTFACDGTITLSNTITNAVDTVLDGSGHQVTISGNNSVRVLHVNTNVSFTTMNLTITNGRSTNGAGIFNDGGSVILLGATLTRNVATNGAPAYQPQGSARGGGIFNQYGTLNATNCAFDGNGAHQGYPSFGGAIGNWSGSVNLQNCVFTANTARGLEGAIYDVGSADGSGGAIYNAGGLTAGVCSFLQNSASGGRGQWSEGGNPSGSGGPGGNGGEANGGAICNLGVLAIDRSLFAGNRDLGGWGGKGGNGWVGVGWPWVLDGRPGGNGGNAKGAALYNGGSANLVNCTFAWNEGTGGGGGPGGSGASFWFEGHLFVANPGPSGNLGYGFGGIFSSNAVLNLTNCTMALNRGGAGIYAGAPGGTNAECRLANTLLASNAVSNSSGRITDAGHNLSSDASCSFTNIGSLNNTDPKLGPLANNGGPMFTMAISFASPALNTADNASAPPTDQRGFQRPVGVAADIGAFELGPAYLSLTRSTGTGLDLIASGVNGQTFCLTTSSNLTTWLPVSTNQFDSTGTYVFHDDATTSGSSVFYRLTLP